MFMSKKTQYCQDVSSLHLQHITLWISTNWSWSLHERQRPRKAKTASKEDEVRGLTLSNFKTYCTARVTQTLGNWQKNRQMDQLDRNRSQKQTHIKSSDPWQRNEGNTMQQRLFFKKCCHQQLDIQMVKKNKIWTQTLHPSQTQTQNGSQI